MALGCAFLKIILDEGPPVINDLRSRMNNDSPQIRDFVQFLQWCLVNAIDIYAIANPGTTNVNTI